MKSMNCRRMWSRKFFCDISISMRTNRWKILIVISITLQQTLQKKQNLCRKHVRFHRCRKIKRNREYKNFLYTNFCTWLRMKNDWKMSNWSWRDKQNVIFQKFTYNEIHDKRTIINKNDFEKCDKKRFQIFFSRNQKKSFNRNDSIIFDVEKFEIMIFHFRKKIILFDSKISHKLFSEHDAI